MYRKYGNEDQEQSQHVIRTEYPNQVLHMGHTISFSGHMGTAATNQRIACHYYWSGMNKDFTLCVKSCPECQRVAPSIGLGDVG